MPVPRSPKRAREPSGLSHDRIRTTALALIDEHGLAAFSTRKLGLALGCEAMAIYWYFPSKDALLDAIVDELMVPVAAIAGRKVAGDDAGWVAMLRQVAHAYRRIAHDHPHAFPLLATRRFASEQTMAFLDRLFTHARAQGVADRAAAQLYRIVSSYCNGFALNELAERRDQEPAIAEVRQRFARVAEVSAWLEPRHADEIFEHGLELLLAPLAGTPPLGDRRGPG